MNETLLLLTDFLEGYAEDLILGLGMLVLLAISYFIPKYIFLKFIYVSLKKKANKIDDILIKHKVLTCFCCLLCNVIFSGAGATSTENFKFIYNYYSYDFYSSYDKSGQRVL